MSYETPGNKPRTHSRVQGAWATDGNRGSRGSRGGQGRGRGFSDRSSRGDRQMRNGNQSFGDRDRTNVRVGDRYENEHDNRTSEMFNENDRGRRGGSRGFSRGERGGGRGFRGNPSRGRGVYDGGRGFGHNRNGDREREDMKGGFERERDWAEFRGGGRGEDKFVRRGSGRGCDHRRSFPEDNRLRDRARDPPESSFPRSKNDVRRSFHFGETSVGPRLEFKETNFVHKKKPELMVYGDDIDLPEVIISMEPSGPSIIRYFPKFITQELADNAFARLTEEEHWEEHFGVIRNETYKMPRQMVWYGPIPYSFSGTTLPARPKFSEIIQQIHDAVEEKTNISFNSVLLNRYRSEQDSVDWHSDDENLFGPQPVIASISLGEVRNFEMRKKPEKGETYDYSQHISIPLRHGSLFIMSGAVQQDWQHRLRKERHNRTERINLTFRICNE